MHILQSKHTKLSQKEAELLLIQLNISKSQLPKILLSDVGLPENCEVGDIIKIIRKEESKEIIFYRVVV